MRTRTSTSKVIFVLAIICDVASIVTGLICYPLFFESLAKCNYGFAWFLLITGSYAFFAIFRLMFVIAHFIYGQRFWRWVKRKFNILSTVEYE